MAKAKVKEQATPAGKAARPSFTVRLQPYDKSLLAEVVQYLTSLERSDAQRQVENVLVMALLAQARLYDETHSEEERRRCCIEACDALEKHASNLRQLVGVEMPVPVRSIVQPYEAVVAERQGTDTPVRGRVENCSNDDEIADEDEDGRSPPKSRIESQVSAEEVDSLFGG